MIEKLEAKDLTDLWSARAGVKITDWAGDSLRLSDGGDGTVYAEMAVFDVCIYRNEVEALRDYLNEVLAHPKEDEVD